MNTPAPTTPPNHPAPAAPEPPVGGQPAGPATGTKVMAMLLCFVFAVLAAVVSFFFARHLGAEALIAVGWAAGTFAGSFYLVQNVLEKFGQL